LQRYFAVSAGICVMIGLLLIFVKP